MKKIFLSMLILLNIISIFCIIIIFYLENLNKNNIIKNLDMYYFYHNYIQNYNNNIDSLNKKDIENIIVNKNILYDYIKYSNSDLEQKDIEKIINKTLDLSQKYNYNILLMLSIMKTESNFNKKAKKNNSYGIMQINTEFWFSHNKEQYNLIKQNIVNNKYELFDIEKNIESGFYILNMYMNKCLNLTKTNGFQKNNFENLYHCMFYYYNGKQKNTLKNNKIYYDYIKKSLGDLIFFITDNQNKYREKGE